MSRVAIWGVTSVVALLALVLRLVHVDTAVACVYFIGLGLFAHWVMG